MKQLVLSLIFSIICSHTIFGGVYFSDTKEETIQKSYSKRALMGEEIVNLRLSKSDFSEGVAKQIYPIFISAKDVTYINFEESIVSVEGASLGQEILVGFNPDTREDGFSLKSTKQQISPKTIQVSLASGNKIYLKAITSTQKKANGVINFLNISKPNIKTEVSRLTDFVNDRTRLLTDIFQKGLISHPIGLSKIIKDSELSLVNVNVLDNTYYYILQFKGPDTVELNTSDINLELRDLNSSFFSKRRKQFRSFNPSSIILDSINDTHQIAVLKFELPKKYMYYQFQLWVAPKMMFTEKIQLNLNANTAIADPLQWSSL